MEKPAVRVTADNTKHAVLSNMMMVMLVVVVVVRYRQAGRQAGRQGAGVAAVSDDG